MPGSFVLSLKKDQQNHVFKNKSQNNKKIKFLIMFLIFYFAVFPTTHRPVKLIKQANQLTGSNIIDKLYNRMYFNGCFRDFFFQTISAVS